MSRTVLITGAAGFLGRHIARQFARDGSRVVGLDDVPPENAPPLSRFVRMKLPSLGLVQVLRDEKPGVFIHCAGRASVPLSMRDPAGDFHDSVVLTFEMLDALRRSAPQCRFILLSSAAVYGDPVSLPVCESEAMAPLSPYGWHKRQAELLCEEFASVFSLPTTVARIFSAYGPGLRRQVVWDICERLLTNGKIELRGTGAESRDFIHANDVAHAIAILAEKAPGCGEAVNLASGRETTIAELARLAASALGSQAEPVFDGEQTPGQPVNWRADIGAIGDLGFAPQVSLEDGVRGVAAWARAELGTP
ncbi:MAG: NAD-dependent epimerase/dehydratase family protein [Chthoniobacteraceae bacterium]